MMTRRDMTTTLGASLVALLSAAASSFRAEAAEPHQNGTEGKPLANRPAIPNLLQQSIGDVGDAEVTMLILNIPARPSAGPHSPFPMHKHSGPVFAYMLEGSVENQVDPQDKPVAYHTGDYWYEPAMHVHRLLRNLSETQPARILIFEVLPLGKPAGYMYPSERPIYQR
ncbi:MAG: cupin domain-containing protein [Candidatus Acidiferrales bacterium]